MTVYDINDYVLIFDDSTAAIVHCSAMNMYTDMQRLCRTVDDSFVSLIVRKSIRASYLLLFLITLSMDIESLAML